MERQGNRSPEASPQGLYPCAGHQVSEHPQWLALSITSDREWNQLVGWLGKPAWAREIGTTLADRRAQQENIDEALRGVFAERDLKDSVEQLLEAGIPAAAIADPRALTGHPQLAARGFLEEVDHPLVGRQSTMGAPFRFASVDHWLRHAAPTLGQHNAEILTGLGYGPDEIEQLKNEKVIGDWPEGA